MAFRSILCQVVCFACCIGWTLAAGLERRQSFLAAHRDDNNCPPVQPCKCWCHCPETLLGEPAPPGAPPIAAVNPYALPPLPPPPLPPPHYVTPAGQPPLPITPAALLQMKDP